MARDPIVFVLFRLIVARGSAKRTRPGIRVQIVFSKNHGDTTPESKRDELKFENRAFCLEARRHDG